MIIFREVNKMKEGIHPAYYQAKVVCNCGNEFVRKLQVLVVELICSIVSMV